MRYNIYSNLRNALKLLNLSVTMSTHIYFNKASLSQRAQSQVNSHSIYTSSSPSPTYNTSVLANRSIDAEGEIGWHGEQYTVVQRNMCQVIFTREQLHTVLCKGRGNRGKVHATEMHRQEKHKTEHSRPHLLESIGYR